MLHENNARAVDGETIFEQYELCGEKIARL